MNILILRKNCDFVTMNAESNWKERKYEEIFKKTCQYIKNKIKRDEEFSIKQLEKMTETAYLRRGNDWIGKGPVKQIEESAIIAAHEHMLAEWKNKKHNKIDINKHMINHIIYNMIN